MSRLLVIGGTGMLRDATEFFITHDYDVTVHGRDRSRLNYFTQTYPDKNIFLVSQDYHETDKFLAAIADDIDRHGVYDSVVCWMHGSGAAALSGLIDLLVDRNPKVVFYHVKGSASYNPAAKQSPVADRLGALMYREVILGFKMKKGGSRWLEQAEISAGVIEAVRNGLNRHLIGVTEPWDSRPGW